MTVMNAIEVKTHEITSTTVPLFSSPLGGGSACEGVDIAKVRETRCKHEKLV